MLSVNECFIGNNEPSVFIGRAMDAGGSLFHR
jgi:hypothetical protein